MSLNFPNLVALVAGALMALGWAYGCLSFAGHLRTRGLQAGYTRKVFHALIFLSAAVAQALGGFVAVCVFGTMVSLVVGLAVLRGPNDRQYEALAREQDGPARTYYIVTSYFATLIGGLASNILFGPLAVLVISSADWEMLPANLQAHAGAGIAISVPGVQKPSKAQSLF